MDAAIYALAAQADKPVWERKAPRRIWFVVDRRIVVDEAFARAQLIADKLLEAKDGPLKEVADRLRAVSGTDRPLAVARLRGGVLRDDGWARLPSQPAVITSTVDQLGSRLLFRGYGHSARTAPIFAGLAAHDSLILLDEAHLSVPFMQTLRAVQRYRGEAWAEQPLCTPFAFAMLSATPPADVVPEDVFPGPEREAALDHPVLQKRMQADKPAELVEVKVAKAGKVDPMVHEAVSRAREFVVKQGMQRVAVVVNRVATAQSIQRALDDAGGDVMDVVLLTGRLRPFERDALVERWQPVLKAGSVTQPERPVILVATQCIEVGADFSFDALVTEAASLDALRQRFGRLNRLGEHDSAPAAVLIRADQAKANYDDVIYGMSLSQCWALLGSLAETQDEGKKPRKVVNFGIAALDELLAGAEAVETCTAPTQDAPLLLPSHLDLLCQTAPVPLVQPDIDLYLHGADRGGPEVRVVWRADLDAGLPEGVMDEVWKETVALCSPNSHEALSVPLYRLRRWLKDHRSADDAGDVEGAGWITEEDTTGGRMKPALVWRGRERSEVVRQPSRLRPDDMVVLPASYGMKGLGQSAPVQGRGEAQLDIWEACHEKSGKPPVLRLHKQVLEPWLKCPPLAELIRLVHAPDWDEDDLQPALDEMLAYTTASGDDPRAPPAWLLKLLRETRHGRKEKHPGGGLVLFAPRKKQSENEEQDLFADDDDLLSAIGKEVPLEVHSALVEQAVDQLAGRCLPESLHEPLKKAAYWHDAGKMDERFQSWLRQGNEPAALAEAPLAKSKTVATSPARRRWLRQFSGLPENFRHEMLSLQLAERVGLSDGDAILDDLALYCVASHHGHGRPFAPVCRDDDPPPVRGRHDGVAINADGATRAEWPAPHGLDSGIPERFWRLVRRYGWWGLAYLEAILRLGDWYGSRLTAKGTSDRPRRETTAVQPALRADDGHSLPLTGIDGANPLGFLAALGSLAVLHQAGYSDVRLSWRSGVTWWPELSGIPTPDETELAALVAEGLKGERTSEGAEAAHKQAEKRLGEAKKRLKKKTDEIKKRGLRGQERDQAQDEELGPLERDRDETRLAFLEALRDAVPKPELAIGANIDCDAGDFRDLVQPLLDSAGWRGREAVDMLAAFASDACLHASPSKRKEGKLAATPLAFITGGGHQDFLGTIRKLLTLVESEKVGSTLFEPWVYADEGLSMRWDPTEDRRYALMDRDPTASGNKPRTVWMANLMAYRALALFPSAPLRGGLATTGWSRLKGEHLFTWPLWQAPAGVEVIRSLLLLPNLYQTTPDWTALRARGVQAVFRSRRIKVGAGANFKINFSPAKAV